jgi:hypothetical protein
MKSNCGLLPVVGGYLCDCEEFVTILILNVMRHPKIRETTAAFRSTGVCHGGFLIMLFEKRAINFLLT